jgi:hypothetical protein
MQRKHNRRPASPDGLLGRAEAQVSDPPLTAFAAGQQGMMRKRLFTLGKRYAVALGAGVAAAVLFSLAGQATWFAMALAYLSPLPIMIAMLGFGGAAGIASTAFASLTVFGIVLIQHPHAPWTRGLDEAGLSGLVFALSLGLPALWLSYLAALSRTKSNSPWVITNLAGRSFLREYCPLERILTSAVAIAATLAVAVALYVNFRYGPFSAAIEAAAKEVTPFLERLGDRIRFPAGLDLNAVARLLVLAAAPAMAASSLMMLMLNLWLAGRVVQVSGRLPRPWPDIPNELRMPRIYAAVFAAAAAAAFVGGLTGLISAIVATALGAGFALQGLAVIHDLSRGMRYRRQMLFVVYAALFLLMPWPLALFALIGLAEAAFRLRDRRDKATARKL